MVDKTSEGLLMTVWSAKRRAKDQYDLTAQIYNELYGEEQEAKYVTAFSNLKCGIGGLVLDLGCGPGLLFWHFSKVTDQVVGVDLSRNLLLEAKHEAAKVRVRVSLVQADADHLPFVGELFDAVFAFTVLQNMPKPLETLKETRRVLKPEKQVVVSGLKKAFPLEEFKKILMASGFHIVSLEDDDTLRCYIAIIDKNRDLTR